MERSNPIQQRIELLVEKWNENVGNNNNLIRFVCKPDEEEMIDTFFDYMHGMDNGIEDITFGFDVPFTEPEAYSNHLLEQLAENLRIWNESERDEAIDFEPVDWSPDYNLGDKSNMARLFIANFNILAASLDLSPEYKLVVILNPSVISRRQQFVRWIEMALAVAPDPQVKLVVSDNTDNPAFAHLTNMTTIVADLDMPNAMQQIAAMGDPDEPSTPYRQAFMKMMQAMEANNTGSVYQHGNTCLDIAHEHIAKDAYWLTQLMVIYSAWSSYEIGQEHYKKAVTHADNAIAAARDLELRLDDKTLGPKYLAQAYMQRATAYTAAKDWEHAGADYATTAHLFRDCDEYVLGTEAFRMYGWSAAKNGDNDTAAKALVEGLLLGQHIPLLYVHGTTYAILIDQLLQKPYHRYISFEALSNIAAPIYGPDWEQVVARWKYLPEEAAAFAG